MPIAWRCGFAGLAFVAAGAVASAADTPVGIVMAVDGATDPPLSPMAEITPGAPIKLGADSKLTFVEYAHCKLVTVAGGTLVLTPSDYKTDGHVESVADGPCPRTYAVTSPGTAGAPTTGALIMRGEAGPPRWPVNAQLVLTGPHADAFHTATVSAEDRPDKPAASFVIAGGKVVAAPGTLPLLPNRRYILRLIPANGSTASGLVFVGGAPNQPAPLVILRLD
ncbi:MAG TPA: hypothetical protein VG651_23765 [Stellaceae bacterium]|nr:hypothetical protein [Stellaceae bacterium]